MVAKNLLYNNIYNEDLQGVVNMFMVKMRSIQKRNAKGVSIRSRIQWI